MALDYIEEANLSKVIILSDSLSVLQSINNSKNGYFCHPGYNFTFTQHELQIIFCWLPSHVGIRGNEKADKAAKSVLSLQPSNLKLLYTDFKPAINKYLLNKWQLVWDTAVDNKLHSIKSILGEWRPALRTDRKIVLARLRIGHSFITHSYLLKGEEQPTCVPCDTPFTIKHILLHCVDFQNLRDKYYKVNSLKELFETIEIHNIFSYLTEIDLFNKI